VQKFFAEKKETGLRMSYIINIRKKSVEGGGVKMATLREEREALEKLMIGPWGVLASASAGRARAEAPDPIRTCFQRDIDRITHAKSFRRLKHKTQVFLQPEGDHYRTRLTHTLEVTRIARTAARALRLNEDLTEAIGLGHDLGHTPFGHAGERALRDIMGGEFRHYEQSLRVVDCIEKDGRGLNLCYETRMGILNHTYGAPDDTREAVGTRTSQRINTILTDLIANSAEGEVRMSDAMADVFDRFHNFMFDAVYRNPTVKGEERKVSGILEGIFAHFVKHPEELPPEFREIAHRDGLERAVCDYVAGMTDGYAMEVYGALFLPAAWRVK